MTLNELLTLLSSESPPRVCIDSRDVRAGDVFVPLPGLSTNGFNYIDQAVKNGAKFIVSESRWTGSKNRNIESVIVADSTEAAAELAQKSRGNPADKLTNLAVTGTNGKTTVAYLVRSIIKRAGQKCGLLGTIIYDTVDKTYPAALTTPNCLDIAEKQKQMVEAGSEFMIMEASSHALDQNRLAAIKFKAAAFTNLAGDHLDYHKTTENYLAAKTKLFANLSDNSFAILNRDSSHSEQIAKQTKAKILWYSINPAPRSIRRGGYGGGVNHHADITAQIESITRTGTSFLLAHKKDSIKCSISIPGKFNVSNSLAAAGLAIAAGFDLKQISAGLAALKTIPGRLERIPAGHFSVFIDYAHSDDALENALNTLRPLSKGRLTVVFGCGGDRDKSKRPRMAKVAEQIADYIVVTSDNPRTENPDDIIDDIVTGFPPWPARRAARPRRDRIFVEPDREKAIKLALAKAENKDIILIAGKGQEDYQIIGEQKVHFSDKEIVLKYIKPAPRSIRRGGYGGGVNQTK